MVNNTPSPQKGLLDMIQGGGKKPDAAQAASPVDAKAQAVEGAESGTGEFSDVLLDKTQDQKEVAAKAPQTKEEIKKEAAEKASLLAKAVAINPNQTKAKVAAVGAAKEVVEKTPVKEKKQFDADVLAAVVAQSGVVPGVVAGAAAKPVLENKDQLKNVEGKVEVKQTSALSAQELVAPVGPTGPQAIKLPQGIKSVGELQARELQQALNTQQAAMNLQQAMKPQQAQIQKTEFAQTTQSAEQSALEKVVAQMQANGTAAPMVLQPIVVQVPVAAPMQMVVQVAHSDEPMDMEEAMDSFENRGSMQVASQKPMMSSQDFLVGRGMTLGVDRVDPRLSGRGSEERSTQDNMSQDNQNLWMPQLGAAHNYSSVSDASASALPKVVNLTSAQSMPISGKVDIYSPMALAQSVQGLAAQGGGTVRMTVNPENLGEVTISVEQARGQKLNVKFETTSNEARDVLISSMPELKQALHNNRFEVGQMQVTSSKIQAEVAQLSIVSAPESLSTMNQWSNQSHFSSFNQNFGQQDASQQQGQSSGDRGWDQYFAHQDGHDSKNQGRQQAGYRRYQQMEANG